MQTSMKQESNNNPGLDVQICIGFEQRRLLRTGSTELRVINLPRREDVNNPKSDGPSAATRLPQTIAHCLRAKLQETIIDSERGKKSTLVSSNKLANRFILERWGIRPSQRRRYKNLFSKIRKQSRRILQQYLKSGKLELTNNSDKYLFGIYQFDDIRGNLIIGFFVISPHTDSLEYTAGM